jgi:hypothetical protein
MSRSAIPLALMAASTAVICFAFASPASRAVFSRLLTPIRITAVSGGTATVASPETVTSFSAACAAESASIAVSKIGRKRDSDITSQAQIR